MLCVRRPEAGEADRKHVGEDRLELLRDGTVDEEVGGEVEHDEEVGHRLEAHHPQGRDVGVHLLYALHLHLWAQGGGEPGVRGTPTYEADHQDPQEDAEHVAEDVHEHDGDEGDRQARLALPLLALPPTQHFPRLPVSYWSQLFGKSYKQVLITYYWKHKFDLEVKH